MTNWIREPKRERLVRSELDTLLESELEPKLEFEFQETAQERPLSDIFYPPRTTLPSCFNLHDLGSNVSFKLRSHYTQMLAKFTSLEDAYLFLSKFEEVCSMVHFPSISVDAVRMKLIHFTLKDSAK